MQIQYRIMPKWMRSHRYTCRAGKRLITLWYCYHYYTPVVCWLVWHRDMYVTQSECQTFRKLSKIRTIFIVLKQWKTSLTSVHHSQCWTDRSTASLHAACLQTSSALLHTRWLYLVFYMSSHHREVFVPLNRSARLSRQKRFGHVHTYIKLY